MRFFFKSTQSLNITTLNNFGYFYYFFNNSFQIRNGRTKQPRGRGGQRPDRPTFGTFRQVAALPHPANRFLWNHGVVGSFSKFVDNQLKSFHLHFS
jgi:hypothetical protein